MRRRDFLAITTAATAGAVAAPFVKSARAQSRKDALLTISESGPNSLDVMGAGTNLPGYEISWNTYDRLVSFGLTKGPHGEDRYDPNHIVPELAESWDEGDMSLTFKLRRDAKFHDGTPVTAKDAKWSFDRAVTLGGAPTVQMKAGSMEKPEQFVAVDDHTFRIDFLRKDRLTFPDLCVPTGIVINSGLAKKHATDADPWATDWLKNNEAGGGAYQVDKWTPDRK
ncbi:MAG TPA: ABC transporter substrate-binding protein [Stellaceae bacterium]|jgi:peptide/nickel transport system substrate-binding protein|nr:ABC transporter substrate-binding protein [Stellaceae bacterium]